ncbi:Nut1p [Ascoidea rubescens DSM 1968]|uniref:Mediator of RNA polymerase II transcription subunit 5 n=1 Tax=Ascoidea rubescens DSM 1968 TaxID=1344418 RepID=A0A1D2VKM2_9ASCO|nr:Med5-domain-containing protein [Ascoidea rubescens DSM 1968]ODV62152.1 Med5-domain-containing protein [Ascoidea rubescens DSM 1968]
MNAIEIKPHHQPQHLSLKTLFNISIQKNISSINFIHLFDQYIAKFAENNPGDTSDASFFDLLNSVSDLEYILNISLINDIDNRNYGFINLLKVLYKKSYHIQINVISKFTNNDYYITLLFSQLINSSAVDAVLKSTLAADELLGNEISIKNEADDKDNVFNFFNFNVQKIRNNISKIVLNNPNYKIDLAKIKNFFESIFSYLSNVISFLNTNNNSINSNQINNLNMQLKLLRSFLYFLIELFLHINNYNTLILSMDKSNLNNYFIIPQKFNDFLFQLLLKLSSIKSLIYLLNYLKPQLNNYLSDLNQNTNSISLVSSIPKKSFNSDIVNNINKDKILKLIYLNSSLKNYLTSESLFSKGFLSLFNASYSSYSSNNLTNSIKRVIKSSFESFALSILNKSSRYLLKYWKLFIVKNIPLIIYQLKKDYSFSLSNFSAENTNQNSLTSTIVQKAIISVFLNDLDSKTIKIIKLFINEENDIKSKPFLSKFDFNSVSGNQTEKNTKKLNHFFSNSTNYFKFINDDDEEEDIFSSFPSTLTDIRHDFLKNCIALKLIAKEDFHTILKKDSLAESRILKEDDNIYLSDVFPDLVNVPKVFLEAFQLDQQQTLSFQSQLHRPTLNNFQIFSSSEPINNINFFLKTLFFMEANAFVDASDDSNENTLLKSNFVKFLSNFNNFEVLKQYEISLAIYQLMMELIEKKNDRLLNRLFLLLIILNEYKILNSMLQVPFPSDNLNSLNSNYGRVYFDNKPLDIILYFVSPLKFLLPIVHYCDSWHEIKEEENQVNHGVDVEMNSEDDNYQEDYCNFSVFILFIVYLTKKLNISQNELMTSYTFANTDYNYSKEGSNSHSKSFVLDYLSNLNTLNSNQPCFITNEGEAANMALLNDWIFALFGSSDGISDELISKSSIKTCFKLTPIIFKESFFANLSSLIDFDTLKEGTQYFFQSFLIGTLLGAFKWVEDFFFNFNFQDSSNDAIFIDQNFFISPEIKSILIKSIDILYILLLENHLGSNLNSQNWIIHKILLLLSSPTLSKSLEKIFYIFGKLRTLNNIEISIFNKIKNLINLFNKINYNTENNLLNINIISSKNKFFVQESFNSLHFDLKLMLNNYQEYQAYFNPNFRQNEQLLSLINNYKSRNPLDIYSPMALFTNQFESLMYWCNLENDNSRGINKKKVFVTPSFDVLLLDLVVAFSGCANIVYYFLSQIQKYYVEYLEIKRLYDESQLILQELKNENSDYGRKSKPNLVIQERKLTENVSKLGLKSENVSRQKENCIDVAVMLIICFSMNKLGSKNIKKQWLDLLLDNKSAYEMENKSHNTCLTIFSKVPEEYITLIENPDDIYTKNNRMKGSSDDKENKDDNNKRHKFKFDSNPDKDFSYSLLIINSKYHEHKKDVLIGEKQIKKIRKNENSIITADVSLLSEEIFGAFIQKLIQAVKDFPAVEESPNSIQ